jgi:guanylate kinase
MMHYSEYDFLVVNDDFETALSELVAVVQSQRQVMQRGKQAYSTLINQLLN